MQTNAPKFVVWVVAVVIGCLGVLAHFVAIPVVTAYAFWFVVVGFAILAVASVVKGM
ncbi:MAG: hypothetical protein JXA07_13150 [Spirochaetes bacterium]|nr:hypothetical protein [Spirochaetota bacterium]